MYDYSPETCLIKDVDGQLYNIIDLWRGIKQPVDPSTIKKAYAPRTCLVENIDGTTVNIIDTILTVANGSGAGTSCLQEVIQARNEYKTLDERLDTENMKIYETLNAKDYLPFKGEYITVPHSKVGYTKGLKIQGKTYQNLILNANEIKNKTYIGNSTQLMYPYKVLRKANTVYTIIAYVSKNTLDNSFSFVSWGRTENGAPITLTSGITGLIVKKLTTNDNINEDWYMEVWKENTTGELIIDYMMVLEGDYTQPNAYIPPYFEGIKSVGEKEGNIISILSTGKNLLNEAELVNSSTNNKCEFVDGKIHFVNKGETSFYSNKIEIKLAKGTYVLSVVNREGDFNNFALECKVNGAYIYRSTTTTLEVKFDQKIQVAVTSVGTNSPLDVKFNLMLEKEGQTTTYEPYQAYSKETLLPYNYGLKGLSNTVYDEIVDNKVIQRVGKIILNGTENWSLGVKSGGWHEYENTLIFYIGDSIIFKPSAKILSGTFPTNNNNWKDNVDSIEINDWDVKGHVCIRIEKSKLPTQDTVGFKKWLQANPVTVYYELAEPVVHNLPIDNREMKTYDGITHISSINAINPYLDCQAPSNPQAVVADLMVANESLSNELDVKTKELQAKDEHLMNENDLLTAKDLDMDFRIFELEEQLTPEVAKLSLSHNSPYLMIERCIERGLYEKEDMLYKMGRYLHGKRLTQEEYDKLKLMMG